MGQNESIRTVTRRRVRDPEHARSRILEAAAAEFAAHGFAGARVDRIARGAGFNKRMLYHYFGDKRGLQQAVLADCRPGRSRPPTEREARLLLWALLEPGTAALAVERLARAGARGAGLEASSRAPASALIAALLEPPAAAAGHRKPRIRLKSGRATGGR